MDHLITLAIFLIGSLLGYVIARKLAGGEQISRRQYDALMQEKTALTTRLEAARDDLDAQKDQLETVQRERTVLHERAVLAESHNKTLEQQLKQQQEQLKLEFKNLSSAIFEDITTKFSTQSEKKIGDLLNPMQLHLTDFKKLVTDSFTTQGKEQHTLKAEIEKIVLQTDTLSKALRGDVKAQGNWGEVILERILEESGLRAEQDYILQGTDMSLTNAEGGRQQPDVIIKLPDNKHIIVDAKVSLMAYERYCRESDETARELHRRDFLKSLKNHINGLESKRYQDNDKLGTPDFVLLFMPVEGAYSFAIQQDPELHAYAWGKKIGLVCPTTLFTSLRTIASLWTMDRQNKNTLEIAKQGGALYDKFAGFVKDMQSIGDQLGRTQRSYDDAWNKLAQGRGNLIGQAEKLKELGAKASKILPKFAQDGEEFLEIANEGA